MVNFDYIAEILCIKKEVPESSCNGKCSLMQQLKGNKKTVPEGEIPQSKWEVQILSLQKHLVNTFFFESDTKKLVFITPTLHFN